MKKTLLTAITLCTVGLVGCPNGHDHDHDAEPQYNTAARINAYLEGKVLKMEGANIPSHPNGFDEDVNYGQATQCYQSVTMTVGAGNYNVVSVLGTLRNAPNVGNRGECDRNTKLTELTFTSRSVLVENVATDGNCFDVSYDYGTFKQEGRGQVSQDGKTLKVELYFGGQATRHRCADGAVGATGVVLNGAAFTGNAVQTYTISTP